MMAITDTVRKYVEAGREALSPGKAQDIARSLAKQGEIRRDQVSGLARDLVTWSRKNRDRLQELIGREVKKQVTRMGVATKEDIDSLKRRVRDLERAGKAPARSAASPAKKSTARPRKKSTASKRTTT
jgi:polyhydroxyalkanoate synthesis regulator phasin